MAKKKKTKEEPNKTFESWIWDAACSIRGAQAADIIDTDLKNILNKIGIDY